MKEQLNALLVHTYVKRAQAKFFEEATANVDRKHIALQVDFSENYAFKRQYAIRDPHWCHQQCTIHRAHAWIPNDSSQSFAHGIRNKKENTNSHDTYLQEHCQDLRPVPQTHRIHAVFLHTPYTRSVVEESNEPEHKRPLFCLKKRHE